MQRTATFPLAIGLAGMLVGCEAAPGVVADAGEASDSAAAARAAIDRAWADHLAAAKAGDALGVSAIYAADVVYAVGGGSEVRGRPAIDSFESRGLRAATVLDAIHTTHALQRAGDAAYEIGAIVGPVRPAGDTARVVTFHFMAQWRRERDGAWRLTYLVGQRDASRGHRRSLSRLTPP